MKLEEQVLSIDEMEYLHELGMYFDNSALCWEYDVLRANPQWIVSINHYEEHSRYHIPALTLQEILDLLPPAICYELEDEDIVECELVTNANLSEIRYADVRGRFCANDESYDMEGAFNMLCWVINNGYLKEGDK